MAWLLACLALSPGTQLSVQNMLQTIATKTNKTIGNPMLQIATGKLFRQGTLRINSLTGILFSNAMSLFDPVVTPAGTLTWTDALRERTPSMVCQVREAMEGEELRPGVVLSYGVDSYLQDLSALMTFHMQIVCSPDRDLVQRLTNGRRGLATEAPPNELVRRMFDGQVNLRPVEAQEFAAFVKQFLGIPRAEFKLVMQAIRTVVTGIHRMGDDLEIAYTLLVAAIESLAAGFGEHETRWEDVSEEKRRPIEAALAACSASQEIAASVKAAIAQTEHVLKRQKFKGFILNTLPATFFTEDAVSQVAPVGRLDLADALDVAYEMRSLYVHSLKRLPHELTSPRHFREQVELMDRRTALTFQGLLRVVRAVMVEYVRRQPQLDKEPCDYQRDIPNIVFARWAPTVWMRPDAITKTNGKEWFEAFLEMYDQDVLDRTPGSMVELRPCLDRAFSLMAGMNQENRRSYAALAYAARVTLPESFWLTDCDRQLKAWEELVFAAPDPRALMLYTLMGHPPHWPIDEHDRAVQEHLRRRSKKSGFRFPRRLDAAVVLELAERHRTAGDSGWPRAAECLIQAAENFPEYAQLRALRSSANSETPICWQHVLLSQPQVTEDGTAEPSATTDDHTAS